MNIYISIRNLTFYSKSFLYSGSLASYSCCFLYISSIERKFVYIDDLCVSSTHRRKGVGRKLFRHIVDYVKKSAYDTLELTVWEFNSDAIKFYESLGMTTKNRRMELKIN
ncbi:GNAT family N-acetyltransferase [Thermoanaerobacterium sp. RBIITD]|uniref:GNAT family N-acetyltransferase n=1 Tax=Thermoanaerobacterium sp. RBIITD TaxID=1550240 RepID=UPI000BBFA7A7|nr:GNAT family N-acetyltransferase [Thermoanaerobacterium sp. RBIITD]SNX52884.1 Acetyltransferase (GNAT) family protein [Thermoanaerobacterium sp. RBIITD]